MGEMMRKIDLLLGAALLGLATLSLSGCSSVTDDWKKTCEYGISKDALGACTSLIESKKLDGEDLAKVFAIRGNAYRNMSQFVQAIQDYDQAIKLNPDDAETFYNRGAAKKAIGDEAGGGADMKKARELDPQIGE
jgi:tetratricopeptide (TPR) repeat protein